jgi:hypothetical protein
MSALAISGAAKGKIVRLKASGALRVGKLPRQDSNLRPGVKP